MLRPLVVCAWWCVLPLPLYFTHPVSDSRPLATNILLPHTWQYKLIARNLFARGRCAWPSWCHTLALWRHRGNEAAQARAKEAVAAVVLPQAPTPSVQARRLSISRQSKAIVAMVPPNTPCIGSRVGPAGSPSLSPNSPPDDATLDADLKLEEECAAALIDSQLADANAAADQSIPYQPEQTIFESGSIVQNTTLHERAESRAQNELDADELRRAVAIEFAMVREARSRTASRATSPDQPISPSATISPPGPAMEIPSGDNLDAPMSTMYIPTSLATTPTRSVYRRTKTTSRSMSYLPPPPPPVRTLTISEALGTHDGVIQSFKKPVLERGRSIRPRFLSITHSNTNNRSNHHNTSPPTDQRRLSGASEQSPPIYTRTIGINSSIPPMIMEEEAKATDDDPSRYVAVEMVPTSFSPVSPSAATSDTASPAPPSTSPPDATSPQPPITDGTLESPRTINSDRPTRSNTLAVPGRTRGSSTVSSYAAPDPDVVLRDVSASSAAAAAGLPAPPPGPADPVAPASPTPVIASVTVVPVQEGVAITAQTLVTPPRNKMRFWMVEPLLEKIFPPIRILGANAIDGFIYLKYLQLLILLVGLMCVLFVGILIPIHKIKSETAKRAQGSVRQSHERKGY